ncbi:Gag-Pol polyprotein [Labeo rohita]|uniref:Gag-Pol polyprotein n=1 Tax=Labeo rohita TaxID=84645 RepID=A0ABQ8L725_LABRO|nr:Gag-Pol polyprotein [Labeo rohita]
MPDSQTEATDIAITMEKKLSQFIATRRGKLGVCTRKQNELKELMSKGNVADVEKGIQDFVLALDEFEKAHVSVQQLIIDEEKEYDNANWYEPKKSTFMSFLKDVETWKTNLAEPQLIVTPLDSISNVSRKSKRSGHSSKSGASSISSARMKAEAEKAALMERAAGLERKHALEIQKVQLQNLIEQNVLQTDLAAANAKVQVLESYEKQLESSFLRSASQSKQSEDGMNSYLKAQGKQLREALLDTEPSIEYANIHGVPKTPLQLLTAKQKQFDLYPSMEEASHQAATTAATSVPISTATSSTPSPQTTFTNVNSGLNDIAKLIVQQQRLSSLPSRDIPVFDGEPLNFRPFMQAFIHGIENKTISNQDRLYYLEQYTSGQPRDLVRSCLHMDAHEGYEEAKRLLEYHFGDEIKLTSAYMERALSWSNIKPEDGKALSSFALFLRGCCNLSQNLTGMEELNLPSNLRLLVSKLPHKLKEKWRSIAFDILEHRTRRATFSDLVNFIEKQARMMQDPLFGDIHQPFPSKKAYQSKSIPDSKLSFKMNSKGSSFATTVTDEPVRTEILMQEKLKVQSNDKPVTSNVCPICNGIHVIDSCAELLSKSHNDRVGLLKAKGICFGCLVKGHMSRDCKRRITCAVCSKKHPGILHIHQTDGEFMKMEKSASGSQRAVSSGLVSLEKNGLRSSDDHCTLAIVPVKVKLSNSDHIVQTYAFLDPGSSASFCTENLRRQLNAKGKQHRILLRTMGQEKPIDSLVIKGLEVSSLEGKDFYELPDIYTQEEIPVSKDHIPRQRDVEKWPHLKDVYLPSINADIDLLIGMNVPKLMEPWRIINSMGNGPFAIRTLLGWVVNGLLHGEHTCLNMQGKPYVYANRISVEDLNELLIRQFNQDFPENSYEKVEMSQEDLRFLQMMDTSAKLKDGHYHLPLPFKRDPDMPNNRQMAEHAELVPKDELELKNGKGWYIPHHGVRHPKKGTLWVVFDCSASYRGTSLNNEFIKCPNLTNSDWSPVAFSP